MRFLPPALSLALATAAVAQEGPWTLVNPKPPELRRPLSADRPDATESPFTVDPGAFQVELSFFEWARSEEDGERNDALSVAPVNLKAGITDSIDLQLLISPYECVESDDEASSGFGDLGLRAKINLWGNEGGPTAAAILPYVTFPTGKSEVSANRVEGGIVFPLALELAGEWAMGAQVEFAMTHTGDGNHHPLVAHTLGVSGPIVGQLGAYVEFIADITLDGNDAYSPSAGLGLTYEIDADTQLDLGAVVGFDNPETEDIRVFLGMTRRF